MKDIIQIVLFGCLPAVFLWAEKRSRLVALLGAVMLCYGVGLLFGNQHFVIVNTELSKSLTEMTVPLAIPLLLFSVDIRAWLKLAKKTILSFLLSLIAIAASATISGLIFSKYIPDIWKMAGMLVGVYTGGTPNMSAIGMALEVKNEIFVVLSASDLLVCGIYFFIVLSIGQRVLLKFLPAFDKEAAHNIFLDESKNDLPFIKKIQQAVASLALSGAILGTSALLSFLIFHRISVPFVIMLLTTLAIATSFSKKIRALDTSYFLGQYVLFIFCISLGSMANISLIVNVGMEILLFTTLVVVLAVVFHFILAYFAKIDADTALITHVAAIYGPAFIGPVADSMRNRAIVVSGLTTGLIGYAVGNYVGLAVAYLLKLVL